MELTLKKLLTPIIIGVIIWIVAFFVIGWTQISDDPFVQSLYLPMVLLFGAITLIFIIMFFYWYLPFLEIDLQTEWLQDDPGVLYLRSNRIFGSRQNRYGLMEKLINLLHAEIAPKRPPHIIVDLRLNALDYTEGLDVVRYIRSRWSATRIVVLTAYGAPEIEKVAFDIGVDKFLHKPVPLSNIRGILFELLQAPE